MKHNRSSRLRRWAPWSVGGAGSLLGILSILRSENAAIVVLAVTNILFLLAILYLVMDKWHSDRSG